MAMQPLNCFDFSNTTTSHRTSIFNISFHKQNTYTGKRFFDAENYRSILECLDGGFNIGMDLIKSMTEYHTLRQADAVRLTSYCKIYDTRLKQQSSLSSYSTNLEVQFHIVETFEEQVKIINKCCENIQQVINRYQKQIDEMYPNRRFRLSRKHYRTHEMGNAFKQARSPLCKVLQTLKELHNKKGKTLNSLNKINVQIENHNIDPTKNEDEKLSEINKKKGRKENKLEEIEEDILEAEKKREKKENIYIVKATEIFKECQQLEKQRLEDIKQTLIDFNLAVHSSKYSNELDAIYGTLISDIRTQQDSIVDLDYWAQTYGITDVTITPSSEKSVNDNDSAIYNVDDEDEDEDEDEESVAITTLIQAIAV